MVTGANKGIGYETALQLARLHATVILACRDVTRGKAAMARIIRLTNNPNVSVMQLDLSAFDSVKAFVRSLAGEAMTVDLLIHNAGGMGEKGTTADGNDRVMQSNYLSAFLLTHLLLRRGLVTPAARVVSVSSVMHQLGHIELDDLNATKSYSALNAYNSSKLMQIAFTFRLQRYLDDLAYQRIAEGDESSVGVARRTAVAVHPGVVLTDFHFHFPVEAGDGGGAAGDAVGAGGLEDGGAGGVAGDVGGGESGDAGGGRGVHGQLPLRGAECGGEESEGAGRAVGQEHATHTAALGGMSGGGEGSSRPTRERRVDRCCQYR